MKKAGFVLVLLGLVASALGQRSEVKGISADDRGKISGAAGNSPQAARDRLFLQNATQGGLGQVELGKLAVSKGGSAEVRQFGQMMVDEHTKMMEGLQPIAAKAQASLPKKANKADLAEAAKLNGLSGMAFDKEYAAYMVKDHTKDLKDFGDEQMTTENPELRGIVATDKAMIGGHLEAAKKLAAGQGGA